MAIYILDNDSKKTAECLDDKSLNNMIKGIVQVLYNCHYFPLAEKGDHLEISELITATNKMRPNRSKAKKYRGTAGLRLDDKWTQWARECKANYLYFVELGAALLYEFWRRNGLGESESQKGVVWHDKYSDIVEWARDNVPDLPKRMRCDSPPGFETAKSQYEEIKYPTPFPLVMPKKYTCYDAQEFFRNGCINKEENIMAIESYRNYYQSKMQQKLKDLIGAERKRVIIQMWHSKKPKWLEL